MRLVEVVQQQILVLLRQTQETVAAVVRVVLAGLILDQTVVLES
jgi:hypothetical protein